MQAQMNANDGKNSDASESASQSASQGSYSGAPDPMYAEEDIDVDLTAMGADMVYATVYDMMCYPETYVGKVVRMRGLFSHSYDDVYDTHYYFVIVKDATACCAQGLEFVWGDPQDYPADGAEVLVTGVYEIYTERGVKYTHLVDSALTPVESAAA